MVLGQHALKRAQRTLATYVLAAIAGSVALRSAETMACYSCRPRSDLIWFLRTLQEHAGCTTLITSYHRIFDPKICGKKRSKYKKSVMLKLVSAHSRSIHGSPRASLILDMMYLMPSKVVSRALQRTRWSAHALADFIEVELKREVDWSLQEGAR